MAARSAATARARSAASLARRSFSRRSRSAASSGGGVGAGAGAGVGWGAGSSGGFFPPQPTATALVARSINRDEARIMTPRSGVGGCYGPAQSPGPRGEPRGSRTEKLTHAAGFCVEHPELPDAAPVGHEREMASVRGPGRIFVAAGRRHLPRESVPRDIDKEDLRTAVNFAMEDDVRAIGGPLRRVRRAADAEDELSQQL